MNSIERVKAALNFNGPDKVPIWKPYEESDVFLLSRVPSQKWQPGHEKQEVGLYPHVGTTDFFITSKLWTWKKPYWVDPLIFKNWYNHTPREEIDEWGVIWKRGGVHTMGHPLPPRFFSYETFDEYFQRYTPDFEDKNCYKYSIELSRSGGKNKYRMCSLDMGPFHLATNIRGFNDLLMDHRRNKENLGKLLNYLTENLVQFQKAWVKNGAKPHGFVLYDDLGEQGGPFFSSKIFEEFYKPAYYRLIENAHELGCDFHLHCCGKIDPLLPLLIEWGLDAVELDSPRMTGYPALKQFRGDLMIWGCVNAQSIYTRGTPEQCEREVWHMVRNLGTPEGGFGAYFYPQEDHIQVPKDNVVSFMNGLKKYGKYAKIPAHWWTYPIPEEWQYNEVPPLPPINM
ncbi:MAG: hypothetical protein EU532_05660 [Promethearchaeota archaeon]|nr:MAG: hypothetical protein EU532_05660 [Candidatus Lokiarchaeota archaeon]